jgi:hypothetical protein
MYAHMKLRKMTCEHRYTKEYRRRYTCEQDAEIIGENTYILEEI